MWLKEAWGAPQPRTTLCGAHREQPPQWLGPPTAKPAPAASSRGCHALPSPRGRVPRRGPGPAPIPTSPCCVHRCRRRAGPHAVPSRLPGDAPRRLQHRPADPLPVAGKALAGSPGAGGVHPGPPLTSGHPPPHPLPLRSPPHRAPRYRPEDGSLCHPNPPSAMGFMGWRLVGGGRGAGGSTSRSLTHRKAPGLSLLLPGGPRGRLGVGGREHAGAGSPPARRSLSSHVPPRT